MHQTQTLALESGLPSQIVPAQLRGVSSNSADCGGEVRSSSDALAADAQQISCWYRYILSCLSFGC